MNIYLGPYLAGDEYALIEALMANTANTKIDFTFTDTTLNIGNTLVSGQDVLCFILVVKTPFNGTTPYATIGTQADPNYYVASDVIDLSIQDSHLIVPSKTESVFTIQPKLYLNLTGATQGTGTLYMVYSNGN